MPNVPARRPRADDARHATETPSRGSVQPVCYAICGSLAHSLLSSSWMISVEFNDPWGDELIPELLTMREVSDCGTGSAEPFLSRCCIKRDRDGLSHASPHQEYALGSPAIHDSCSLFELWNDTM